MSRLGMIASGLLGLFPIAGGAGNAAPHAPPQVQGIQIADQAETTRVDVRLTRSTTFDVFTLANPDRVVVDLRSATLAAGAMPRQTSAGPVRHVRVARRPDGVLRIVFDLSEPVRAQGLLADRGKQPRLLIEMRRATFIGRAPGAAPQEAPAASAPPVVAATPPLVPPPASPSAPAPETIASGAPTPSAPAAAESPPSAPESVQAPRITAAPTASEARPVRPGGRELVIAVDAGHGGHDPGARGPHGVWEKDVTLAISRRLAALLDEEPGMRGILTRQGDQFVVLRQHMERARAANADLFVSIHADAARDSDARGSTVYVLSEKGATDEAARRLAARENAADLIGGVDLGNKDPVLASVLMDLSQNASISSSFSVGAAILDQIGQLGPLHRGVVQQAPFMVLKSPDVPSVLIETAYITNPDDERNLDSDAYQDRLARAILAGIRNYFQASGPRGTVVAAAPQAPRAPAVHVVRTGETLSGVADRYGVSVQRIRSENGLRGDQVRVGQRLRIPTEST